MTVTDRMVLGFVFDENLEKVLLIKKLKPEWQNGLKNGIGGKVESFDSSVFDSIHREVLEESALDISEWKLVGSMNGQEGWRVDVFCTVYGGLYSDASSVTKEKVEWHDVDRLPSDIIPNLRWLVPMCKDFINNDNGFVSFSAVY